MRQSQISARVVEFIPERLKDGVLYVSQRYSTAAHKCCCGCGSEIVTPLTTTDWSLQIDDGLPTLYPSIGNWSIPCGSHYWIRRGVIVWAGAMSQYEIDRGRRLNHAAKEVYFEARNSNSPDRPKRRGGRARLLETLWSTLTRWWRS